MFAKTIVFTLLAACGVTSNPSTDPDKIEPPEELQENQHWCCNTVSDFTGEGCVAIAKENINTCKNVLYCEGNWMKQDGKVTCA